MDLQPGDQIQCVSRSSSYRPDQLRKNKPLCVPSADGSFVLVHMDVSSDAASAGIRFEFARTFVDAIGFCLWGSVEEPPPPAPRSSASSATSVCIIKTTSRAIFANAVPASALIIIHSLSAGSGYKPSATIDCLESIARRCE
jgi:hypothetical protein